MKGGFAVVVRVEWTKGHPVDHAALVQQTSTNPGTTLVHFWYVELVSKLGYNINFFAFDEGI
jgi:hypothetical protein